MFDIIASAIRMSVPIVFTSMGAIYSERSGVVNIGLEGMMIMGAFWGAAGAYFYGPVWGIIAGMCAGLILAALHALVSVTFKVDQIVSGVALNILAYGIARFSSIGLFKQATASPKVPQLGQVSIPGLDGIPALHPLVTGISPLIIIAFLMVPLSLWVLNRTVFGLRLRSVGENPAAADSLGINVSLMRYAGVLISGAFAGVAGAYLSIEHVSMYVEGMTQGRGYIALAAMIFGNWSPGGALVAGLLFGLAEAFSLRGVGENAVIPYQFIKMIPYILTIVVLAGFIRRATPPAADGIPYDRAEQ